MPLTRPLVITANETYMSTEGFRKLASPPFLGGVGLRTLGTVAEVSTSRIKRLKVFETRWVLGSFYMWGEEFFLERSPPSGPWKASVGLLLTWGTPHSQQAQLG